MRIVTKRESERERARGGTPNKSPPLFFSGFFFHRKLPFAGKRKQVPSSSSHSAHSTKTVSRTVRDFEEHEAEEEHRQEGGMSGGAGHGFFFVFFLF